MKKIILGLFLTVGISGATFAEVKLNEEIILETNTCEIADGDININTSEELDFEKIFDCYYITKLRYNFDGEIMDFTVYETASSCINGDEDGTISIKIIKAW